MKLLKKAFKFAIDNYFISIFLAIIVFVGFVSVYKLFFAKPTFVYVKVKLGQGLWWATTAKPSIWMVNALKKGEKETNLTGKPIAEILSIRYYPWWGSNQYDSYLTLKLKVTGSKKTKKYSFKRSTIGVGSPIDLEFPSVQVSGTIIELSEKPLAERFVNKFIYLSKKNAYPWEYEAIKVGDSYFDGQDTVFQVLDTSATDTQTISSDTFGNFNPSISEQKKYIMVKAKIKLRQEDSQYFFGEDQLITLGKTINVLTPNFTFNDYTVSKIE